MTVIDGFLLAVVAVLMLLLFWQGQRLSRLRHQLIDLETQLSPLGLRVDALLAGTNGVAGRIRSLEQRVRRADERHDELQQRQGAVDIPLRQAVELARKGAVLNELVDSCGLSSGEAELLIRLYGPGQGQ